MKRCIIIGGADIEKYDVITKYLTDGDFYIYCDSGLKHLAYFNKKPDLIVGDFDSHVNPHMDVETIVLPCEKDDTDTVFAVKEALKRGFDEFLLVGVIGARLDHTLGNVSVLSMLHSKGISAKIIDDYSEMEIVDRETKYIDNSFAFFSLLNVFGEVDGVNIRNAKYPLENAVITCDYQYGISNEPLADLTAEVEVRKGRMLLIKIRK
ncbi:MAG: thiamine diphosphokinase [Clostridia bacterium]|nr:thiamine diphosphokinase [Clostridia bacterium]